MSVKQIRVRPAICAILNRCDSVTPDILDPRIANIAGLML